MSCSSCDADALSGCELKVIQYSIINANPYIEDCEDDDDDDDRRVLFGPNTISTTQNLSPEAFTAWVIALNIQKDPDKVRHCDKQYLRVCWSIVCRVPLPAANYPKRELEVAQRQVKVLEEIRSGLVPKKEKEEYGSSGALVRDEGGKKK